jgi:hypothetical protein
VKMTIVATVVAFFLCSGCALVGHTPNRDAKNEILNSTDWSASDVMITHSFLNMVTSSSDLPYSWEASTNTDVSYTITNVRSYMRSNHFAKDFTLVKSNKNTGETVTTTIVAMKKMGLEGSDMPGPCKYSPSEFSFCLQ